jgi:hypothetical protein
MPIEAFGQTATHKPQPLHRSKSIVILPAIIFFIRIRRTDLLYQTLLCCKENWEKRLCDQAVLIAHKVGMLFTGRKFDQLEPKYAKHAGTKADNQITKVQHLEVE